MSYNRTNHRRFLTLKLFACSVGALVGSLVHASVLESAEIRVLSGYYNSDSHVDILLLPKQRIVLISYEILIPVIAKPAVPAVAILSRADGTYYLESNISRALINDSAWQDSTHTMLLANTLGAGSEQLLVLANQPGSASFLISYNHSNDGAPSLLQDLSPAGIGFDLAGAGVSVLLQDENGDGRDDLLIRRDGVLTGVVYADPSGAFVFLHDELPGSIMMAWRSFCVSLSNADINSALFHVHPTTREQYQAAINELGAHAEALPDTLGEIQQVSNDGEFAEYAVMQTVDGQQLVFLIAFEIENGVWKLVTF